MRKLKLFRQRTFWVPTWQGWLVILSALVLVVVLAAKSAMPFLAPTRPVHGSILVVEGWVPDYALQAAVGVFRQGAYRKLVVTGTSIEEGRHITVEKTYAQLAASTLRHSGFEEERLVVLPSPNVMRDRTYTTALTVKQWLRTTNSSDSIDVFTLGPHARRTWLLYKLAIGEANKIGVISFPSREYDPARWWKTSSGFREIIDETVAYLYAKFVFGGD